MSHRVSTCESASMYISLDSTVSLVRSVSHAAAGNDKITRIVQKRITLRRKKSKKKEVDVNFSAFSPPPQTYHSCQLFIFSEIRYLVDIDIQGQGQIHI